MMPNIALHDSLFTKRLDFVAQERKLYERYKNTRGRGKEMDTPK